MYNEKSIVKIIGKDMIQYRSTQYTFYNDPYVFLNKYLIIKILNIKNNPSRNLIKIFK